MELIDTHCHIHEAMEVTSADDLVRSKWAQGGFRDPGPLIDSAVKAGVTKLICVGCTLRDSRFAVELAGKDEHCDASIGIHPHEAKNHTSACMKAEFAKLAGSDQVVAVGECGLDYYYGHSPRAEQVELLEFQLQVARDHDLPVIFHVRDAFADFLPIIDQFPGVRGVVHSFTAHSGILTQLLSRGLYIGLNGIMTFTKDRDQLEAARAVPLDRLLLETDAPFLTPTPYRGTICQPKHVVEVAGFLSGLRNEPLEELAAATTNNAKTLFNL